MAEKRMTKLNPLIKLPNPLDLEIIFSFPKIGNFQGATIGAIEKRAEASTWACQTLVKKKPMFVGPNWQFWLLVVLFLLLQTTLVLVRSINFY